MATVIGFVIGGLIAHYAFDVSWESVFASTVILTVVWLLIGRTSHGER